MRTQETDIIFLQEVTQPLFDTIREYTKYTNIETNRRGTAILTGEHMPLTNRMRLPSGSGMAAELQGVWLVNIYAPSGAEKRKGKEGFFNIDLPYLVQVIPTTVIVGGDFNCIFAKMDSTGHFNYSRALNELVRGFDLVDMWASAHERGIYKHYTRQGARRWTGYT